MATHPRNMQQERESDAFIYAIGRRFLAHFPSLLSVRAVAPLVNLSHERVRRVELQAAYKIVMRMRDPNFKKEKYHVTNKRRNSKSN